jgi:hypothetical protein
VKGRRKSAVIGERKEKGGTADRWRKGRRSAEILRG